MKRNGWLIFVGIAILVALVIYLLTPTKEKYDWNLSYERSSDQPYGLQLLYNLLKQDYTGNRFTEISKPLRENLNALKDKHDALYFIAGGSLYLDSASQKAVMDFVSDGNDAFIAADYIPYNIYYDLLHGKITNSSAAEEEENANYYRPLQFEDSTVTLSMLRQDLNANDTFKVDYIFDWKFHLGNWNYFFEKGREQNLDSIAALGVVNNTNVNFIRVIDHSECSNTIKILFATFFKKIIPIA